MADIALTQAEADALMAMAKSPTEDQDWNFPAPGERLVIPLISADKRESFFLDIGRGRIKLTQATYQNRARQSIVLLRLDIQGPPHTNPDGQEMPCPHLHVYREGYGDKWAVALPPQYAGASSLPSYFNVFIQDCRIVGDLRVQWGLT